MRQAARVAAPENVGDNYRAVQGYERASQSSGSIADLLSGVASPKNIGSMYLARDDT